MKIKQHSSALRTNEQEDTGWFIKRYPDFSFDFDFIELYYISLQQYKAASKKYKIIERLSLVIKGKMFAFEKEIK